MKEKRVIVFMILFLFAVILATLAIVENNNKERSKKELIELSNVKYELANVDVWKEIIQTILVNRINDFELSPTQKGKLVPQLETLFTKIIEDYEDNYNREEGLFKVIGANIFGVFSSLKSEVPNMVQSTISKLDSPENKKYLKEILILKINEVVDATFAEVDYSIQNEIIEKYSLRDRSAVKNFLAIEVKAIESNLNLLKILILTFSLVIVLMLLFVKKLKKIELTMLLLTTSALLIMGLYLPMIEIDARVSEINFSILGEVVSFNNQVLYYKSKSILEVVELMIAQGGGDMLTVGVCIFLFSVLFPISKIVCSLLLIFKPSLKDVKVIYFLIYKTGKWSMADVMVVSIFMAYIGFSGILTEQLGQIEKMTTKVEVLTTNNSHLQIGFIAFFAFAVISMLITAKIDNNRLISENEI